MYGAGDTIEGAKSSYTVDRHIGSGGFGHTYKATSGEDEAVALKVLRIEKLDDWKALELFEREARALRGIDHPQIPTYVEFFAQVDEQPVSLEELSSTEVQPDALFLVQHYVDGADLRTRMDNGESFTSAQVADILRQVLDVLTYLHERHPPVIHRDINPRNLILGDEGRICLVDFGAIQQKLREETVGGSTSVGTLGYVPIEQSFGKARPASDLYALGVTCVALMTGQMPSEWPIDDETSKISLAELGLDPSGQVAGPRRRLMRAVDQMLEPLVAHRVPSARDVLAVLDGEDARANEVAAREDLPEWKRYLFYVTSMGGLGSGAVLYIFFFDELSETELVQLSWIWLLPMMFGFVGLALENTKRPILYALGCVVGGALGLACFFGAIWPSL
ncbi:MAG: serine/threonine protein kinase [Myxococcota bacterium]